MKTHIGIATLLLFPALALAHGGDKKKTATLTDSNIVAIASAAHQAEIDASQIAIGKSMSAEVKTFANMMVADHTMALEKTKALGIPAEDNDDSKKLKSDAIGASERLKGLDGADFDKAYLEMMVSDHKNVLTALDKQLIPNAKNSALRQLLKDFRPKVAQHLKHAEELAKKTQAPVMN